MKSPSIKTQTWLGILAWWLIFLDGWFTTYLVHEGLATELNPVSDVLIQMGLLVIVKVILAGLVVGLMWKYKRLWPYLLVIGIHAPLVLLETWGILTYWGWT